MSQSLDISDLIQFKKKLSDVVDKKTVRKLFRAEHRAAGEEMKRLVRDGLPGSKKGGVLAILRIMAPKVDMRLSVPKRERMKGMPKDTSPTPLKMATGSRNEWEVDEGITKMAATAGCGCMGWGFMPGLVRH